MISFGSDGYRFDLRAAVVLLEENRVLLHRLDGDTFWALPGGRVEAGESAAEAAVREMMEELSEEVLCERLVFVVENFYEHAGRKHHEVGLYFAASVRAGSCLSASAGPYVGREGDRSLTFAWFDRANLRSVDLRPSFLVDALASSDLAFRPAVHRDGPPG